LGTALLIQETGINKTTFRGIDIYREEIEIDTEICSLCTNNCCISIATVSGEKIALVSCAGGL